MTITQNVASKLFVGFVAVSMLFSLSFAPAKAATAEELQAQITALLAQVASLQGQLGQGGSSSAGGVCPFTWTRDLTVGASGDDVMKLQSWMIANGASIPAGATGYFGAQTQAALAAWQSANAISPAAGYFGPITRAKVNSMCTTGTPSMGDDDANDDMDDDANDDGGDLQGEASLDKFELKDGDDTELEEGQEEASVAEMRVEFSDGDAMINRIDLAFVGSGDETDPWDSFDTVSLMVDGEEVASMDASDEDEYLDEDDGSLRFSGLDIRANEDEEVTIEVAVTVAGSVDLGGDEDDWTLTAESVRFTDADDVTTTDDETGSLGGADEVDFTIDEAGFEDELIIKSSTEDPDATTLVVEDDTRSDWMTFFVFDLDTDDSVNDIELNNVQVGVHTGTEDVADVVDDLQVIIDGETFDDVTWAQDDTNHATANIDIDGDMSIDAGDRVAVEVQARFKAADGSNYTGGETIQGTSTDAGYDAEGADDLDVGEEITGSATGDVHTLRASGITLDAESVETETDTQGDNDTTGIFTIEFDVTALEGDFYIDDTATTSDVTDGNPAGVGYSVDGPAAATFMSAVLSSTGEDDSGAFLVREGETETFTLTVTIDASATGQHRVTLDEVWFSENSNGMTSSEEYTVLPASDYRTDYENINAS